MRWLFTVALIGGLVFTQGCAGLSPDPPLTLEDRMRAVALLEQAKARIASGNTVIARGELHEAINLATRGKWLDLITDGHFMLGQLWEMDRNFPGAAEAYGSAYAASRQLQDRARGVKILNALGNLFLDGGLYDRALDASREALRLAADSDVRSRSTALNNIGEVHRFRGQHPAAFEAYSQSLKLAREAGLKADTAIILNNMGVVSLRMGKKEEAQANYREALALAKDQRESKTVMEALNHLAALLNEEKRYGEALPLAKEAEELARREKFFPQLAQANLNLGVAEWRSGNREEGRQRLTEALRLFTQVKDPYFIALTKFTLGSLALEAGDRPTAQAALEDSLRIFRELKLSSEASQAESLLKGTR